MTYQQQQRPGAGNFVGEPDFYHGRGGVHPRGPHSGGEGFHRGFPLGPAGGIEMGVPGSGSLSSRGPINGPPVGMGGPGGGNIRGGGDRNDVRPNVGPNGRPLSGGGFGSGPVGNNMGPSGSRRSGGELNHHPAGPMGPSQGPRPHGGGPGMGGGHMGRGGGLGGVSLEPSGDHLRGDSGSTRLPTNRGGGGDMFPNDMPGPGPTNPRR